MKVPHPQIKVTLTKRLHDQIQARADELGTTKANYLRLLVLADLKTGSEERNLSSCDPELSQVAAKKIIMVETRQERRDSRLDVETDQQVVRLDDLLAMI